MKHREQRIAVLKMAPFFHTTPQALLRRLAAAAAVARYTAGSMIFREGEPGDCVYIISKGTVRIEKDGLALVSRGPGEWIGEFALLDEGTRSSSAVAETSVTMLRLSGRSFHSIVMSNRRMAADFNRMLAHKLREDVWLRVEAEGQGEARRRKLQRERDAALEVLNMAPFGVILAGPGGRIALVNNRARQILERSATISVSQDGLAASDPDQARTLRKLLQEAALTGAGLGVNPGGALRLEANAADAHPLSLFVAPVSPVSYSIPGEAITAAVFLTDEKHGASSGEILRKMYGLTPAEAAISIHLIEGKPVRQIAAERDVAVNTVRYHLKSIFQKTGAVKQSDLVRLVLSGPAAVTPARPKAPAGRRGSD